MTCREKLKIEHPNYVSDRYIGGCFSCPYSYYYLHTKLHGCLEGIDADQCTKCWDREIPD